MENKKTLKIGRSDFGLLLRNNHYFVDKSQLIYDFYYSANDILLMPRPKRFGKTLNLSMIEHFFDIQKPESAALFSELEIAKNTAFCNKHQNKYPVINLTLKKIKEINWEKCILKLKTIIANLYEKYLFLLESDKLNQFDKRKFENIVFKTATEAELEVSLENLSTYLHKHFKQKVIILIDEYDTPIINAYKNTPKPIKLPKGQSSYYEKVVSFMQSFLGDAFKGNDDNLHKGLITGVMRVARESIFSDWNKFSVYGITSTYFSDKFGFTQVETSKMLTYFGLENKTEQIDEWYNGYKFGNTEKIYNPWSIVNYITHHSDGFKPYRVNTSDDSLIKERLSEPNVKKNIEELMAGKTIEKGIRDNFIFADFETNTELLWTLMFYNGLLTYVKQTNEKIYELRIPNYELRTIFKDFILEWIEAEYKFYRERIHSTANHLVKGNLADFETGLQQIIGDTLSYFDINGKEVEREQIFHVYTLGLLAVLSDNYSIKSNRESGEGRYDIMLIPYDRTKNGVVIELKTTENQKENESRDDFINRINKFIGNALEQIEQKNYYQELISADIASEKIVKAPVVFAGKKPYITKISPFIMQNNRI